MDRSGNFKRQGTNHPIYGGLNWETVNASLNETNKLAALSSELQSLSPLKFEFNEIPYSDDFSLWAVGEKGTIVLTFDWDHERSPVKVAVNFDSDMNILERAAYANNGSDRLMERFEAGEFDETALFNYDTFDKMLQALAYKTSIIED